SVFNHGASFHASPLMGARTTSIIVISRSRSRENELGTEAYRTFCSPKPADVVGAKRYPSPRIRPAGDDRRKREGSPPRDGTRSPDGSWATDQGCRVGDHYAGQCAAQGEQGERSGSTAGDDPLGRPGDRQRAQDPGHRANGRDLSA